ncbi:MAG: hypothetical protein L0Z62_23965 [Gemmataceae bacterium]|nr:hypothetical protein [Gemmataceae bacterium]
MKTGNGLAVCAVALSLWALTAAPANAQVFSSGEIERGLRPGPSIPYDGAGFSHRYNYRTEGILYLNGSSRPLHILDYYDRLDRAERFGYRLPPDPFRRPVVIYGPPCYAPVSPYPR